MKPLQYLIALLSLALLSPLVAQAADRVSVHAVLVLASGQKGPADPRLAAYEAELQRNLPESSFRFAGDGSAIVPPSGRASIPLSGGYRVELERVNATAVNVRWMRGGEEMLSSILTFPRRAPIVLVRRPSGNEAVPLVIVEAR